MIQTQNQFRNLRILQYNILSYYIYQNSDIFYSIICALINNYQNSSQLMSLGNFNHQNIIAQHQKLKASLANRLIQLKPNPPLTLPVDYETRVQQYKDILKTKLNQSSHIDIMIARIEGRKGIDMINLSKELVRQLGGDESTWNGKIKQYLELKNYGMNDKKNQIWQVKEKFIELVKSYYNIDQLKYIRKLRQNNKIIIKDLTNLINLIQSPQNKQKQQDIVSVYSKILREQMKQANISFKPKITKKKNQIDNIKSQALVITNPTPLKQIQTTNDNLTQIDKQMNIQKDIDDEEKKSRSQKRNEKQEEKCLTPDYKKQNNTNEMNIQKEINLNIKNLQSEIEKDKNKSKVIKPNNQKKLMDFFFLNKKKSEPIIQQISQNLQVQKSTNQIDFQIDNFISIINKKQKSLTQLKSQFLHQHNQMDIQFQRKSRFIHINIWDSYYYFKGFELKQGQGVQDYKNVVSSIKPQQQYQQINYQQQSQQQFKIYLEYLANQSIEGQSEKSQQSAEQSGNDTIVSDFHLSIQQIQSQSEADENQNKKIINSNGGEIWSFDHHRQPKNILQFMIVCIQQGSSFPLAMKQHKQKIKGTQKLQFITLIHGSYQNGDQLVQKLKLKLPEMSKNRIKNYINQISLKQKSRRLIKPYFLEQNRESIQQIRINLEQLLTNRQKEYEQANKFTINKQQKLQFLKVLHGNFDKFEILVENLKLRLPDLTKNQIKNYINQISIKQNTRRIVKVELIQQLKDIIELQKLNIQQVLSIRLKEKELQKNQKRRQKSQRKKQKIIQQKNLNKLQFKEGPIKPKQIKQVNQVEQPRQINQQKIQQKIQIKDKKKEKIKRDKKRKRKNMKKSKLQQNQEEQFDQDDQSYHPS